MCCYPSYTNDICNCLQQPLAIPNQKLLSNELGIQLVPANGCFKQLREMLRSVAASCTDGICVWYLMVSISIDDKIKGKCYRRRYQP